MIDWDDVRYFLAVARGGSVRAAAERLGVNHATVLRRIAQLEERLGAQMFEKLPSGYRLTAAGEEVLEFATRWKRRRTSWRRASSGATRACAGFCG
jgi:DNA-binding transcriptional LysR family regulator